MRLALAALLAVHAAVQAALLSAPGVDVQRRKEQLVLSPRLLRLRGGEDDEQDADEDESSKRALSRGEIIAKLNEVPTFCVTNEEGGVAMFRMKETDEKGVPRFRASVCFFLEPEEAKAAMQAMQLAMPQTKLKLSLHGLGAAFEHCRGWQAVANSTLAFDEEAAAAAAKEELPTTPAGEPVEMKIMGNHALVNSTSDSMRQMVEEHGMQAGCWSLPVFISNELQSKSILPAFVRPSDLKNTWLAAGRTEDSMPQDIVVIDRACMPAQHSLPAHRLRSIRARIALLALAVRVLVAQMLTDMNDWTRLHFVPSDEAVQLAQELEDPDGVVTPDAAEREDETFEDDAADDDSTDS